MNQIPIIGGPCCGEIRAFAEHDMKDLLLFPVRGQLPAFVVGDTATIPIQSAKYELKWMSWKCGKTKLEGFVYKHAGLEEDVEFHKAAMRELVYAMLGNIDSGNVKEACK